MKVPTPIRQAHKYCTAKYNAFVGFFLECPTSIDRHWRRWDLKMNRNYGGWPGRALGIEGYSVVSLLLPLLSFMFLLRGPIVRPAPGYYIGWIALGVALCVLLFTWRRLAAAQKRKPANWNSVAILHVALSGVLIAAVILSSDSLKPGIDQEFYRHTFLFLGIILYLVMVPAAAAWAHFLFLRVKPPEDLVQTLTQTDLFRDAGLPRLTVGGIMRSLINAPFHDPLFLLFVPSVIVVFTPRAYRDLLPFLALASTLVTWVFLAFPSYHERIRSVIELTHRCLFVGGQLLVSLAIIVLAIGRLADFGYIATVVEASRRTIVLYALCSYSVFWLYEYWMNRVLTERLLRFFRSPQDPIGCARIDASTSDADGTGTGRVLQIHGAARFIALRDSAEGQLTFESYERPALFDALAASNPALQPFVDDVKSRTKFYLFSLNLTLLVIAVSLLFALSRMKQIPQVTVSAADPPAAVDFHSLVFDGNNGRPRDHVILLAASGGGTRAALYTASVLHGLAELNELDNLVLASGVSGGSTALAYFGAHRHELKSRDPRAWKKYYDALSQPFIQEVLEGATEWRINKGHRLGCLLAESFSRHLRLTNTAIGQSANLGLIFNTALAGHLCDDSGSPRDFEEWANDNRRLTRSDLAGGRLIFTNLRDKECFPRLHVPGSFRMKYVVVQSSNVSLASAAALSANFPPVFSNAAVDKDQTNRFWVTDGGAADNRGIDSLLFALRGALREQKTCTNSHRVPMIHIIVADASAATIDYQQDRGMGSKFGAPEKFATQLMEELIFEINDLCQELTGKENHVRLHYLSMPNTLRMRGGLGTHWMLPKTVKLTDTTARDPDDAKAVRVSSDVVRKLICELHQTNALYSVNPSREQTQLTEWIERDEHRTNWLTLVRELKHRPERKTFILDKQQTR